MSVLREVTQESWRRADDLIDVDRRVPGREPVFDSLVVVLEVIAEVAIRKRIVLVDVEERAQHDASRSRPRSRGPQNLRDVARGYENRLNRAPDLDRVEAIPASHQAFSSPCCELRLVLDLAEEYVLCECFQALIRQQGC